MRNRGDRRYRNAQIKKRLIAQAIRSHNSIYVWGDHAKPVVSWEELPREGWYCIRRVLRNEGKARERVYRCGESLCDWCADNLRHKYRRQDMTMVAELKSWSESADAESESRTIQRQHDNRQRAWVSPVPFILRAHSNFKTRNSSLTRWKKIGFFTSANTFLDKMHDNIDLDAEFIF